MGSISHIRKTRKRQPFRVDARHTEVVQGRRLGTGAVLVGVLSACTSTPSSPTVAPSSLVSPRSTIQSSVPRAAVTVVRPCEASRLKIAVGHTGTGGGQQWGYLKFENGGIATCSLRGWPFVRATRADGTAHTAVRVRSDAVLGPPLDAPPQVVLAPGQHADAVLLVGDNSRLGNSCPAPYRALLVSAPGSTRKVRLSAWIGYADSHLASCYTPEVGPILPSRDLYQG